MSEIFISNYTRSWFILSSYHFIKRFYAKTVLWHPIPTSVWGISWNDVGRRSGQDNYINWSVTEWYVDVWRYYLKGIPLIIPGSTVICYTTSMHFAMCHVLTLSRCHVVTDRRTYFILHRDERIIYNKVSWPTYFLWLRVMYISEWSGAA